MKTLKLKESVMKILMVFIVAFFVVSNLHSQHQIRQYDVNCGAPGYDFGRSIINRIDKGYAIAGYSYQAPPCIGSYDWMFLKLKEDGSVDCSRLIGLNQDDKSYSLIQSNSDTGYVLAGYNTRTNPPYRRKATFVKLNKDCNITYARSVFDTLNSSYYQVIKDPSNTWGFAGYIETSVTVGINRNKILVNQNASSGVTNWAYRYVSPGLSKEEAYSLCFQNVGGSYGVAARTNYYSGSSNVYDVMLMKLDYAGGIIWRKVYRIVPPSTTFYPNTEPRKIIPMPDGGFTVVGFTNAYNSTQSDIFVLRVNSGGIVLWSGTYGRTGIYEVAESVTHTSPYLVLTGSIRNISPPGSPNAFMLRIPEAGGAPLWMREWDSSNPTDAGFDIINSSTGTATSGYAVTGNTIRPLVNSDPFLWRTNSSGFVSGATCNQTTGTKHRINNLKLDSFAVNRVQVTLTTVPMGQSSPPVYDSILCLGTSSSPLDENDPNENQEIDNEEVKEYSLMQNSPNPFNPVTTIYFELPLSGFTRLNVYDISGRLVSSLINDFKNQGRHRVTFDGSNLSSGVYYYKIESEGFTEIKKMILIK